ncbi:3'(2'),5'-bisphosphate nucleotidase CysQ [Corticibacterium sp. UT-5YL-CI-8]|nr:3'(2'),5'-bisphosphate nucleotidase CysQ [Tianweitania sp. UT-5YL-CI-8]
MQAVETYPDAEADLELLREAAAEAGRIALRYFRKDPEVWMKTGQSPVSEADYAADKFLRETLLAARPDYGWLSEETADDLSRLDRRRTFVVDPIDGTRGFLAGGDVWCVSAAVVDNGRTIAGVLECPAKSETFTALPGGGAFLNKERLAVRPIGGTPTIGGPNPLLNALPAPLKAAMRHISYVPSLAYRVAMIAAGRLDATFVRANSHDWDLAAADLILWEAGGRLVDPSGERPYYASERVQHGALAAGSGELLDVMVSTLARVDR